MDKIFRAIIHIPCGIIKIIFIKLFHFLAFSSSFIVAISPLTEISLNYGGKLKIGKKFKMRDGAKIRVRKNAKLVLGKNFTMGSNCIITCRDKITIGNNVLLGPNVFIYDHDHKYTRENGVDPKNYKTSPIAIGDNCWIATNTVILRGTKLGKNCIVGAGSVLKGDYPDNSIIVQKRETNLL